jgi:hypothetical protein
MARRDPDPETRLRLLLAVLAAASATDRHVRATIEASDDVNAALHETLEALRVQPAQFLRLAKQLFDVWWSQACSLRVVREPTKGQTRRSDCCPPS